MAAGPAAPPSIDKSAGQRHYQAQGTSELGPLRRPELGPGPGPPEIQDESRFPTTPWRPAKLIVSPPKRAITVTRPRGPILGPPKVDETGSPIVDARGNPRRERLGWRTPGKEVPCWDLTYYVDGWEFAERFPKAGLADGARAQLQIDCANGLLFDPSTKRFVEALDPQPVASPAQATPAQATAGTVYSEAIVYMRAKWPEWEPKTRREASKALRRACLHLSGPGAAEPSAADMAWLDWVLKVPPTGQDVPPDAAGGEAHWLRWSTPIAQVTASDLQDLVQRYRVNERNPNKLTRPVDPDVVLSMPAVWWLAAACASAGSWGGGVAGFVLMMGICGLRPGEAAGVRIEDFDLPASGPGWVRVRRSKREVAAHWLDPDEDPMWGPLKDRDLSESRRAPIPGALVRYLREIHLPRYCPRRRGLLFERNGKPYQQGPFTREVWEPARAVVLPRDPDLAPDDPQQPALSRLRRHDLRHAACSMWLNTPNVDVKVAQRWSGHRTLSVFLDIYQGIMPGREVEGAVAVHEQMQ